MQADFPCVGNSLLYQVPLGDAFVLNSFKPKDLGGLLYQASENKRPARGGGYFDRDRSGYARFFRRNNHARCPASIMSNPRNPCPAFW